MADLERRRSSTGSGSNRAESNRSEPKFQMVPFYKMFTFADRLDVVCMAVGSVAALANGATHPMMTLFLGHAIDSFGSSNADNVVHHVSKVSLKFFYLAIYAGIMSLLQISCWTITGERQAARIRGLYLKTILRQDIAFFDTETTTGEVIGRMSSDTALIQEALGEKVGKFMESITIFLGCIAISFIRGWELALVLLPCIPLIIISSAIKSLVRTKLSSRTQLAYVEAGNVAQQTLSSIKTVASFTGEREATKRYDNKLQVAYRLTVQQGLASGVGIGVGVLLTTCTYALALWYGTKMIIHKGYNGGQVITIMEAMMDCGQYLGLTSSCVDAFAAGQAAAYKMFETIKRVPRIDASSQEGEVLEDIKGEIELKDVYFRYPARPDVEIFSGFSLWVHSGTTAALVGQSGSGKSTVISLVERFYDPDAGQVLIDGVDLRQLRLSWVRKRIGLVSQEPVLFATTLKENIKYGKEDATDEEIGVALERANASKFVDKLPMGLDTMVGEHGGQLSGGQKQRIAIARAILKNPKILLLDEATSALDAESERIVQDALDRIMSDRTTLVVAHRLTTVKNADIIAVVHQGKLVEQGTHEELIQDPSGAYFQLAQLQQVANQSQNDYQANTNKNLKIEQDHVIERSESYRLSRRRSLSSVSSSGHRSLSGITLPVDIDEEEENGNEETIKRYKNVSMSHLAYLCKRELPVWLVGTIFACGRGVIFPIFGLLLSTSIKVFYEPPHLLRKDARFWALVYLVVAVVGLLVFLGQSFFFGIAGGRLMRRIRFLTFDKVIHQEISWFDNPTNSSGAIGARLSSDAVNIRGVGDQLAMIVGNIATCVVAFLLSFAANWILALVVLVGAPVIFSQGYLESKYLTGFSADAKLKYEEASRVAGEAIGGIRTVASFCSEKKVTELYDGKCEAPVKQGIRMGVISGVGLGFSFFALYCINAFCFFTGALLIHHGKAEFSQVFLVFFALSVSVNALSQFSSFAIDSTKVKVSVASIFDILDRVPSIDSSSEQGRTLNVVRGDITLDHISFRYPTRPDLQIFNDLCLTIPSGKTVALVGESGSGKSTVISLIERFYDPDSGTVLLDDIDIREFKLSWLRQQMGLVSQEPILFNDTIRANIAYGRGTTVEEDEIIEAAKAANAHAFVSALPQGYETVVGERGLQLSGGQKQRIAIARAMVRRPRIVLLDEATSALDSESERVVQEALERVAVDRTTVVVAHRLATVKNADVIAVVKNGVVAEEGRHEELIEIPEGVYASLVSLHSCASN